MIKFSCAATGDVAMLDAHAELLLSLIGREKGERGAIAVADMADAIAQCARLVTRAMPLLANIGQHAGQLNEICLQLSQIEGQGDEIYDRGLRLLYERSKGGDPMAFLRGKEVYEHLEQVVDRRFVRD